MPIYLYHSPSSAPCHAVRLVAAALGVELNLITLNIMKGDHLTPAFTNMNPQSSVPTINDNGFYLWESRAICTYLVEKYAHDDALYPKDLYKRSLINQRLYFDVGTLYQSFSNYIYPELLAGFPPDPVKMDRCEEAMFILNKFLEGRNYVAGDHITVADFVLVTSAVRYSTIDFDISPYKNVRKWVKKMALEVRDFNEIVIKGLEIFELWMNSAPLIVKRNF